MQKKFTLTVNGRGYDIDLEKAPEAMLSAVLRQGCQILIQRSTAGMKNEGAAEKAEAERETADELNAGTWTPGGGGGGPRLDGKEIEARGLFKSLFMKYGMKATEAEKVAASEAARKTELLACVRTALAAKGESTPGAVAEAAEKTYAKIMAMAERQAAAAKKAIQGLDL